MHDNSDREDAERHAQGEEDAVSEIGEVFHRDVVRAEKRGRDEATDVPEEDVGGGGGVGAHDDDVLLERTTTTTTGVHAPSFLLPLSLSLCFFFVKKKKKKRKNHPIFFFLFFVRSFFSLDTRQKKRLRFSVWTRKDQKNTPIIKHGKGVVVVVARKEDVRGICACIAFFVLRRWFSHDVSRVVSLSLSLSLSLPFPFVETLFDGGFSYVIIARYAQDKEVLVRIVKDAQRSKRLGTDGTFVEFVEKHAQTEKLKHTHDPNRHDWQVLVKFVESVVSKEQNEGENEAGEIEETAKDNKKATIKFEETISRHVSWQKKNKKRHEWKAWHESCDNDDEKYGEEGSEENALWKLVNMCEESQQFDENYNRFPSHMDSWLRTSYRPGRWCVEKNVKPRMVAIDCEMCETTTDNKALCAVSAVDEDGNRLFDALVKPSDAIVDYRHEITGYTEADFKDVTLTLDEAREKIVRLLEGRQLDDDEKEEEKDKGVHGCILVGHSLSHDLRALRLDHRPVIDTSLLFSFKELPRATPALADLCKMILGYEMREKGSAHDAFADALTAMKVVKRIVEKSISKTEFVLPAPERLLVLFEARKQAAKENRKNGTPTPNKKRKGNFDESHGKKTNRVAGRTLFIHRLPRGVTKEGIESIFENVIKTKSEKEEGLPVITIETIKGKFEMETGENAPETETVSMFASSARVVVPASKHAPTTSAYVAFDSVKSARLAFERLNGALSIDALGRPQKKAKISKRFGFEKLICVRNDTITEQEEEEVDVIVEEKEKAPAPLVFPPSSAQKKKPRQRKPKMISLPGDK